MSAVTIQQSEQVDEQVQHAVALPRQRGGHLRLVPQVEAAPARVRGGLTIRGRVVLSLLAALVGVALLALAGHAPWAGSDAPATGTRTVVVHQGETLWQLAGQVAPGADRSTTVAEIVQLNKLPSTDVDAGQHLRVPATH